MIGRNYRLYMLGGLVFAILIYSTTVVAGVVEPQLQRMLAQSRSGEPLPIIVTLNDQVDLDAFAREAGPVSKMSRGERRGYRSRLLQKLRQKAAASQGGLRQFLHSRGHDRVRDLWHINSLAFSASPELIASLAARPEVAAIKYDRPVYKPVVTPLADSDGNAVEDNIDLVGAPQLWALGLTGTGTTVAIVDSGVFLDHQDLVGGWRGGSNSWFNAVAANCSDPLIDCVTACDTNTATPCDYLDLSNIAHGTGVAGIAVGGDLSGNAIGVAPGAQWIAAKIFDNSDNSSVSIISQAFAWLLDPDGDPLTDDAPDVVNASWGYEPGQCVNLLQADVQALQAAGIAMVFSSGNDGPASNTSVSPANYPESFAVGSVGNHVGPDTIDYTTISDFSGRGPSACGPELYPDVVAPGYVLTADFFGGLTNQYISVAGTSFSAPHIAGVMALLLGEGGAPGTSPATLYQILRDSATDLGGAGPDNDYGYGLVNALTAFELLNLAPSLEVLHQDQPLVDLLLDFGENPLGDSVNQDLTLRNVGGGTLSIAGLDLGALAAPFSLVSDQCSGANLDTGQDCTLRISFAPAAAVSFQGSFLINSNDDLSPAQIFVAGQGGAAAPPQLTLSDNTGAGGDALVEFDQVTPGTSVVGLVTVGNAAGAGPLQVESLATTDLPAIYNLEFTSGAPCNPLPKTLLAGQSCTIQVRYSPNSAGSSGGSFQVLSNDPTASGLISVSGFSNTPPPAAQLQSPADGSSGQSTSPTLLWIQQPDAESNQVGNTVQIATNPHFINPTSLPVASQFGSGPGLLLGGCGFAALLLPLGLLRKRKLRLTLLTLAAAGLLILVSCGGGGGGDTDPNLRSQQVFGLASGTTYYWRVLSDDGQGGMSQSEEFSFSTR